MELFKFDFNQGSSINNHSPNLFSSCNDSANTGYIPMYYTVFSKKIGEKPFESFIYEVRTPINKIIKIHPVNFLKDGLVYRKAVNSFLGKTNSRYIHSMSPLSFSEFKYKKGLDVETFIVNLGYFERYSDSKLFMLMCISHDLALKKTDDISWLDLINKNFKEITIFMDKELLTEPYRKLHTNIIKNLGDLYMNHIRITYCENLRDIIENKDLESIVPDYKSIIKKQKWLEKNVTDNLIFT